MLIKSFTVSGVQYNVAMATAVNQRSAMLVLSKYVMTNAVTLAQTGKKIDSDFIKGILVVLPEDKLIELDNLLLQQAMVHGTSTSVSINDFQGKTFSYFGLLAQVIEYNLADFFTWLDCELESVRQSNTVQAD